jgi:hypothetical protein
VEGVLDIGSPLTPSSLGLSGASYTSGGGRCDVPSVLGTFGICSGCVARGDSDDGRLRRGRALPNDGGSDMTGSDGDASGRVYLGNSVPCTGSSAHNAGARYLGGRERDPAAWVAPGSCCCILGLGVLVGSSGGIGSSIVCVLVAARSSGFGSDIAVLLEHGAEGLDPCSLGA